MGLVHAEIELINATDIDMVRRFMIGEEEIRQTRVRMLVDSGASKLCINENIQAHLDLGFVRKDSMEMANGEIVECDVVGPVEVRFANRASACHAFVLPGDSEPLLGVIPMEDMDLHIHPFRQELVANPEHEGRSVLKLMTMKYKKPRWGIEAK